jgi:hypothetical protein
MNLIKIGLVLITGAGFGFGVDKLADTEVFTTSEENFYEHMEEGCHSDVDFIEHMLDDLSEEDLALVQAKIDELLVDYDITLEELYDDYEVRYDFMNDLMDFLEENEIEYHYHGGYHDHHDDEDDDWHGGMGMH